jgi:hypothetical protein
LEYQGWRYPVKVSKQTGLVTSGHGRILAAKRNGWKEVPVSFQDYEDETQEIADVTSDNAIASWAELDLSMVNAFAPDLGPDFDIDLLGIKDFVLEPAEKFEGDEDAVPEVPEHKTKRGELWILGVHRLLIDDCTVKENVERLMGGEKADMVFTDPPYGIDLDTDYTSMKGSANSMRPGLSVKKYRPVHNDNKPFNAADLFEVIDAPEVFLFGANYYVTSIPLVENGSWVVWERSAHEGMDKMFGSAFELCWSQVRHRMEMARIPWKGVCGHVKSLDGDEKVHPTQKPVKLPEWFFDRWGKDAKNIWDGYLGSGTTLIACEKTNRKCFGMEIDPHYGSVIIERWQKFTGKTAVREDGVAYSDL